MLSQLVLTFTIAWLMTPVVGTNEFGPANAPAWSSSKTMSADAEEEVLNVMPITALGTMLGNASGFLVALLVVTFLGRWLWNVSKPKA